MQLGVTPEKIRDCAENLGLDVEKVGGAFSIYKELIQTEINYLNSLALLLAEKENLIDRYKEEEGKLSRNNFLQMLDTIYNIHEANNRLLRALLEPNPAKWIYCFNNLQELYAHYAVLFGKGPSVPQNLNDFFQGRNNGKTVESILIEPIQRTPRYKLLFADWQKKENADFLDPILEAVGKIPERINEIKRQEDQKQSEAEASTLAMLHQEFNTAPNLQNFKALVKQIQKICGGDLTSWKKCLGQINFSQVGIAEQRVLFNAADAISHQEVKNFIKLRVKNEAVVSKVKTICSEILKKRVYGLASPKYAIVVAIHTALRSQLGLSDDGNLDYIKGIKEGFNSYNASHRLHDPDTFLNELRNPNGILKSLNTALKRSNLDPIDRETLMLEITPPVNHALAELTL